MTVTDYMTICSLGPIIVEPESLNGVLSELKAQGRNLNQLTTLANMGRITILRGNDIAEGYAKLYEQVRRIAEAVS